ncbi:MAG: hypothetical protein A6F70_02460 [Cycloclasticus sp. symbiont of Bathymodiolus heckerae]|nr:MAG: hypothetical protein A6F70_02460 [Cycloclasticus sp. symbiont of Bathymodiolus heckerae]
MQANVGGLDKTTRIIVGLIVVLWGILMQNYWGAIGLVFIGTAVINWCPAYVPFGINSAKKS